jgi:hypothetical protein
VAADAGYHLAGVVCLLKSFDVPRNRDGTGPASQGHLDKGKITVRQGVNSGQLSTKPVDALPDFTELNGLCPAT